MYNKASKRSLERLYGMHYKLVAVVAYALAISEQDFFVNEGLRSAEDQNKYFKQGTSKIDGYVKRGRHQDDPNTPQIDARAVDVYYVGWKNTDSMDDPRWEKVYQAFRTAAENLHINIVFGADWKTFVDKPHIELHKSEK